jgi:hypothetical protein
MPSGGGEPLNGKSLLIRYGVPTLPLAGSVRPLGTKELVVLKLANYAILTVSKAPWLGSISRLPLQMECADLMRKIFRNEELGLELSAVGDQLSVRG